MIDQGNPGYQELDSGWSTGSLPGGHDGSYRWHTPGTGQIAAQWTFSGLAPGTYAVYATWVSHPNRATDAKYLLSDGVTADVLVGADQTQAPDGLQYDGLSWESLGVVTVQGDAVTVRLSDQADGIVIADAMLLVEQPDDILEDGTSAYTDWGAAWFAGALPGAYLGDYRVASAGDGSSGARWTRADLEQGYYDVYVTWTAHTNRASNASFALYDGTDHLGDYLVNETVRPDDINEEGVSWERLATVRIENGVLSLELTNQADGFVVADAVLLRRVTDETIIDNTDLGYSETGDWATSTISGFLGETRYHQPGTGEDSARWSFTDLENGYYRVEVAYSAYANRASNAPFTVTDGFGTPVTVRVDQRIGGGRELDHGVLWRSIGVHYMGANGGTLRVTLSDDADGIVSADAVRIVKVDELPPGIPELDGIPTIDAGDFYFFASTYGGALHKIRLLRVANEVCVRLSGAASAEDSIAQLTADGGVLAGYEVSPPIRNTPGVYAFTAPTDSVNLDRLLTRLGNSDLVASSGLVLLRETGSHFWTDKPLTYLANGAVDISGMWDEIIAYWY